MRFVEDDHVIEAVASDRSDYFFGKWVLHGERGAVTTSAMPMVLGLLRTPDPYTASRSWIKYGGSVPHGNASVICCATDAAVRFGVAPKCTIRRRW